MDASKKIARIVGVLYIIGTVTGVLCGIFTEPIFKKSDLLMKAYTNGQQVVMGLIFLLIMGISLAWVPVLMYPVLKKHNKILAIGYVVFRGALETVTYLITGVFWLLIVVLGKLYVNATASNVSDYKLLGDLLLGGAERSTVLTTIVFSLGAIILYYSLYKSRIIPRWLSGWGLLATLLYLCTGVYALFKSSIDVLLMPLAVQEMVMAVWLIVKGFNLSATDS
jgi:hypothetical protein